MKKLVKCLLRIVSIICIFAVVGKITVCMFNSTAIEWSYILMRFALGFIALIVGLLIVWAWED